MGEAGAGYPDCGGDGAPPSNMHCGALGERRPALTAARPAGTPYPSGGSGLPPAGELLFVGVDGHCATIRRSTS